MIKKLKEMMTDGDNTNTQSYGSLHSNGKNHPLIHIHSNYLLLLMVTYDECLKIFSRKLF